MAQHVGAYFSERVNDGRAHIRITWKCLIKWHTPTPTRSEHDDLHSVTHSDPPTPVLLAPGSETGSYNCDNFLLGSRLTFCVIIQQLLVLDGKLLNRHLLPDSTEACFDLLVLPLHGSQPAGHRCTRLPARMGDAGAAGQSLSDRPITWRDFLLGYRKDSDMRRRLGGEAFVFWSGL